MRSELLLAVFLVVQFVQATSTRTTTEGSSTTDEGFISTLFGNSLFPWSFSWSVTNGISEKPCVDDEPDCQSYGREMCLNWTLAKPSCRRYCGLCYYNDENDLMECEDKYSDCGGYGPSACLRPYNLWASRNCKKYCGYCIAGKDLFNMKCEDEYEDCESYQSMCSPPVEDWVYVNCMLSCGFCNVTKQTSNITTMPITLTRTDAKVLTMDNGTTQFFGSNLLLSLLTIKFLLQFEGS